MKKISLFISMVLISSVIGVQALAQTTANQVPPVKASDAGPRMVTKATIEIPIKNSGSTAATSTTPRPLSQNELRAVLPLKPGGTAGTGGSTGVGANKAIPAVRPGGQPGGQSANGTNAPNRPPIKSASSGQVTPN